MLRNKKKIKQLSIRFKNQQKLAADQKNLETQEAALQAAQLNLAAEKQLLKIKASKLLLKKRQLRKQLEKLQHVSVGPMKKSRENS